MFQLKYDTSEYFDFMLVDDNEMVPVKNLNDYLEVSIDFSKSALSSAVGNLATSEVVLQDISLTGNDNFFIPSGVTNGVIDTTKTYTVHVADHLKFWPVSGYTQHLNYNISDQNGMKKLDGGFYQGFFKLFDYPVEFFDAAISKGWTANLTVYHNPTTVPNSLNSQFPDNEGFIFYLGTRAENKFNDITDVELELIKADYNIDLGPIQTTLYTQGGEFTLTGSTYVGRYNYVDGQWWTGYEKDDTSQLLHKVYRYEDVTNNAFGIRITPDGYIGYRSFTEKECTDLVTTGTTTGSTAGLPAGYIWADMYEECTDTHWRQLVTPDYKVIEQYSKLPVFANKYDRYTDITITFERYFTVTDICQLTYSKYRKGTLTIFVNGLPALVAQNVDEVFTRELDAVKELQEGVPFILSVGGGTQGLYEAVYLDPQKHVDGILEKFFAGSYTGSVRNFNFYTTPADFTLVREKTINTMGALGIPLAFGGRTIMIY